MLALKKNKLLYLAFFCLLIPNQLWAIAFNYTILEFPDASATRGRGINDLGEVVGVKDASSQAFGFLYSNESYSELTQSGWVISSAYAINNNGVVTGEYGTLTVGRAAFVFDGATYTDISPDWMWSSRDVDVNQNGVVLGVGLIGTPTNSFSRGFLYDSGLYTPLEFPGWSSTGANDINNNGEIIGEGYEGSIYKAFLYSSGVCTDILPPGWEDPYVYDINDHGDIVGWGDDTNGIQKGFLYRNGSYTEILPTGWQWSRADAINDHGVITGFGRDANGTMKGYIATPITVPEPTTLALMGLGLAGIGYRRHRSRFAV